MKKMTKKILTFVLASAMMLSCAACGNSRSQSTEEETETTAETTTETTSETTPESTVWGEINDLTYGISELTLTNYTFSQLNDEMIEGSGKEEDAVYSIPAVDASEPDEDGYVTYVIDYNITGTYDIEFANEVADHTDGWHCSPRQYNVVDYYTGTILCDWENSYNPDGEEIAVTINTGEEEVTVYVSTDFENDITVNESNVIDEDHWGWHVEYTLYMTITLRAPQSYDGMLLAIDTTGWTEEDQLELTAEGNDEPGDVEGDLFVEDLSDNRFSRVNDLIIEG